MSVWGGLKPSLNVLSAHKKVKACEVINLSLALLTFRKVWVFYRTPVLLKSARCEIVFYTFA